MQEAIWISRSTDIRTNSLPFFEVEEGIEKYRTIKLIIQPLIENAIYYGMEYMDGEGEIYIRAYTKDQELFYRGGG